MPAGQVGGFTFGRAASQTVFGGPRATSRATGRALRLPGFFAPPPPTGGARLSLPAPGPAPAPVPGGGPALPTVPTVPPPKEESPALGGLQSLGPSGGAEGEQLMGPGALRAGLGNRLYPELSAALAGLKRIY